ncbi:DUF1657 domain-containing protein [Serpentinicella sp. ANB-PHB4]|uniref:DUF1657 domain-containing protein n=1 Tax=Serpentinicella sp. ANB-PHB4 TaxID=3074076 RepID=UPI00285579F3|nr:DUF1657 domain-containing protein [Serpentinicella sp. ANB-PHB4]MDR5658942.1 DUF1657 domain-containing protein [Serpentinicella sp. ANB-PHB4]
MTIGVNVKKTIANLKGSKSTMKIYAIQAQNDETKNTYEQAVKMTDEIIKDLEERLKKLEYEEPQYKGF